MKQESDHSPLLWSVVIAIFGLATIAFYYRRECEKTRNQFFLFLGIHVDTRHPKHQKGTPRNNADHQLQLWTPLIVSTRETQK